ncbi:MAG: HAMP domain-containing histidine kinase [Firmicutes bacterium]|nr:HAMP domain-containing histidine kinase [Bacillota bacterium]
MNLFQIIFLDVVLLIFPILVYLLYLSTDKNISEKSKKIYLSLVIITSFFLLYNYGIDTPKLIPVLVLNSIVIFSYLEDRYVIANFISIFILFMYNNFFNYILFLLVSYILISILYLIKKSIKLNNLIFVNLSIIISSIVYYIWIFKFNNELFNSEILLSAIICYLFIVNIICLMYETGEKILQTHLTYKELQQEKQIRLSLFKITHEIKNPIAVCKGYLDMINVKDSKQVERYVPIIKSEIERLLSILQDFLLINRDNLDLDIMDFNMLVEDTIHKLNPLLSDNNINLNLDIVDDEIFINGDYNRLSQVLINIIKNSIEAIPENSNGKINISTKIKDNKYYLVVEDNGIGMNEEVLANMKKPFYTTKKRGSGLGVSLIYEIVEAHNGKIEYTSEYGKGTKVILQLPLYE